MMEYVYQHRVRYFETDQMNYVYHGNYVMILESARTEMLRSLGFSYAEMEKKGVFMPVTDVRIKFLKPAYFDDLLDVHVKVHEAPSFRLTIHYDVCNSAGELLTKAHVVLAFVDGKTKKSIVAPQYFQDLFIPKEKPA